jgi:hypothetical protein
MFPPRDRIVTGPDYLKNGAMMRRQGSGTKSSSAMGSIRQLARRAYRRLEPELESWLVDTGRFSLIFASLLFAYAVFRLLRAVGVNGDFIDGLEAMDHFSIAASFVMFLLTILRRGLAAMTAPSAGDSHD